MSSFEMLNTLFAMQDHLQMNFKDHVCHSILAILFWMSHVDNFHLVARVMREVLDVDVTWASHMAEQLHLVAGMTDIHNQVVSTHYMSSSNLSNAIMYHLESELQSFRDFLAEAYHLEKEEYDRICQSILEECRRYRSFQNHVLVWARKRLIEDSTPASIDRFSTAPSTVTSSGSPSSSYIPTTSNHSSRHDEKTSDIYQFVHGYVE